MEENKKPTIETTEEQLNLLFRECLEGCRDDLEEAKSNCEIYYDAVVASDSGKSIFGQLYNDALKIKGDARDKQLKILNMFKDRVSVKERNSIAKKEETIGSVPSQSEMIKIIEEIEKTKTATLPSTFDKIDLISNENQNKNTFSLGEGFYLDEEFEDETEDQDEEEFNNTENLDEELDDEDE